MTKEHWDLVLRFAKPGTAILSDLQPGQAHLLHMAVGVSGEAGELLDAIKKHAIYQKELDYDNVKEELGDLMFYMVGIMQELNLTPEEVLQHNVDKLTKRYGDTYSNEAAQERADKCEE